MKTPTQPTPPSPSRFSVSVYAIALNEERFAKRWYECFSEADEICVLDTGSTDRTVEILRSLGAKVTVKKYDKWKSLEELDALTAAGKTPWRFDEARNAAMSLCSPDSTLLLCADMDDVIEKGWKARLQKIWEQGVAEGNSTGFPPNAVLYTYGIVYPLDGGESRQTLLRHSIHTPTGWKWKGRCHEYIEREAGDAKNFVYAPKFGFESRPEAKDHTSYLPLLEADARDGSADGRAVHLLAREYMQRGRTDDAIAGFLKYLSLPAADWDCERAATMKFLADCYGKKGDATQQEIWLWKAMMEMPTDRDAPYALGRLLNGRKDYKLAQKVLLRCVAIEKPDDNFPFFTLEAWTERPWLALAEAYFYDGKYNEALNAAYKAKTLFPKSRMAQITVSEILAVLSNPKNKPRPIQPRHRIELSGDY